MSSTGGRATARPAVIPDDVDDPAVVKASGRVTLPLHVRWSGPEVSYDLDDRRDRLRVYEQVLREGTADDVRRFIDVDVLIDAWEDLYLPSHVRAAWQQWLAGRPDPAKLRSVVATEEPPSTRRNGDYGPAARSAGA